MVSEYSQPQHQNERMDSANFISSSRDKDHESSSTKKELVEELVLTVRGDDPPEARDWNFCKDSRKQELV